MIYKGKEYQNHDGAWFVLVIDTELGNWWQRVWKPPFLPSL